MANATACGITIIVPVIPAIKSSFQYCLAKGNQIRKGKILERSICKTSYKLIIYEFFNLIKTWYALSLR
jgi:hypothetical protein